MKFIKKPYCFAIIISLLLTFSAIFVLLDTFVIEKVQKSNENIIVEINEEDRDIIKNKKIDNNESENNDKDEEAIITENSYKDSKIEIEITMEREMETTYYVANIVIKDASLLKTAFANNSFGRNIKDTTSNMAEDNNAILAINGDFYGFRDSGYVLRNGELYRSSINNNNEDLVIDKNGDFKIIKEDEVDISELESEGVMQIFSFGPALVENGQSSVDENDEVGKAMVSNPRTAIGQIDNLHYIMIVSDGRTDESEGFTLKELSEILIDKGCITAYNLDGGGSATMVFNGKVINKPTTNGKIIKEREVSDIVYIGY